MSEEQGFKKELSPLDVWGLALGAIVGWGCFILPGNAFLPVRWEWQSGCCSVQELSLSSV